MTKGTLVYDGLIFAKQTAGGISTYLTECLKSPPCDFKTKLICYSELSSCEFDKIPLDIRQKRVFELLREVDIYKNDAIFHSPYYRVPNERCRTVITVHDFVHERYLKGIRRNLYINMKKRAILRADRIICVSNNTFDDLKYFYPNICMKKVRVILNGVSEIFTPLEDKFKQLKPSVLYVGSRASYKNFKFALHAVLGETPYSLTVVGGGPFTRSEKQLISHYGAERVEHCINPNNCELNLLYNKSLFLFYPSSYEGFGIPIVEAMRAGCPVVTLRGSSISEVALGAACYLDELSLDAFKRAIKNLDNTTFRNTLVASGIDNAKRFSWRKTIEMTHEVYREFK